MRKKAAVELSANFLVVIILGIFIFSMGIWLAYSSFSKGQDMQKEITAEQERQIWNILDNGNPVVAPVNHAEIKRGESDVFGVGVRNIDYDSNFKIVVEQSQASRDECGDDPKTSPNIMVARTTREIKDNDEELFNINVGVKRGVKTCDYIYNVEILRCTEEAYNSNPDCTPDQTYYLIQKLYVTVP